jgi:hypothetical protein
MALARHEHRSEDGKTAVFSDASPEQRLLVFEVKVVKGSVMHRV